MKLEGFPIELTDWDDVPVERHEGESGYALWRTRHFGTGERAIRVRMVEYSAGYVSDHWCQKGHVIFCMEGEMDTHLSDGRVLKMRPGHSYQVADNAEAHASRTKTGVKLFIVD